MATALEIAVVIALLFVLNRNRMLHRRLDAAVTSSCRKFVVGDELRSVAVTSASGKASELDLQHGRFVVAIVDPNCGSCAETVRQAEASPHVQILSLAEPSRTFAALKPSPRTFVIDLRRPLGKLAGGAPQIFTVDGGRIVRTCLTISECS